MRGLAVVSVIAYHLDPAILPGGFIGVDIFFVISGFVVSLALPSSGLSNIWRLLAFFYARRATRILPALYVCLIVTALLSALFVPPSWLSGSNEKTGLAAVRGYSNFVLAHNDGDYFAPRAEYNMFTHTWSLGVEEQFYILFPFLFLPWLRRRHTLSIGLFLAGCVISLGLAIHGARADRVGAFYLIFSRFWELGLGVLAYQFSCRPVVPGGDIRRASATAVCAAAIGWALLTGAPRSTPFPDSLLPCGAAAYLLVLIRQGRTHAMLGWLQWRPSVHAGRISYSLYLWHWPIFTLFRWTLGLPSPANAAAALVLTILASEGSYRFIERPPRRVLARGKFPAWMPLCTAALLVLLAHPLEQGIWSVRHAISLSSVARHKRDWYPDPEPKLASASGCKVVSQVMSGLAVHAIFFTRAGCLASAPLAPSVFMIGDSHAGAYTDLLADYVLSTGASGHVYYEGGCALLGVKPNDPALCDKFIAGATADAGARMRRGDVVFLPGLRIPRMVDESTYFGEARARAEMFGAGQKAWRAADLGASMTVLSHLVQAGAQVVLEAPKPEFAAPPFRCHDWFDAMNPICAAGFQIPRATIEELRLPVMAQFRAVLDALPNVRIWDPLPLLCPRAVCSAYDGAFPLFFDGDHVSAYANRKLAPAFRKFLSQAD